MFIFNYVYYRHLFTSNLSYAHGKGTAGLIGATIGQLLEQRASLDPDKEAVVVIHQDVRLTFQELLQQVWSSPILDTLMKLLLDKCWTNNGY